MATKILRCPKCSKYATWHAIGGVQCCHCGYREQELVEPIRPIPPTPTTEQNSPLNPNRQPTDFDLDVVKVHVEPGKQINLF